MLLVPLARGSEQYAKANKQNEKKTSLEKTGHFYVTKNKWFFVMLFFLFDGIFSCNLPYEIVFAHFFKIILGCPTSGLAHNILICAKSNFA